MSVTSGPNLPQNGLIFNIDCASDRSFMPGSVLINSVGLSGQSFAGYCGSLSNVTYNTNEVQAPDGTYTATKVARDSSNSCGAGGAYGIFWNNNSTVQAGQTYTNSIYAKAASGNISLIFGISDSSSNTYTIGQNWTKITRTVVAPNSSRGIQALTYNLNYTYYLWSGVLQNIDILKDNVKNISCNIYNTPTISVSNQNYITLDGTNQYINIPSEINAVSILAFIRMNTAGGGNNTIYGPWANGHDNWLSVNNLRPYVLATETTDVNNFAVTGASTLSTGVWYQIGCTISENTVKIYVNGREDASVTKDFTIGTWNSLASIGRRGSISQNFFNGDISMVQVYDKVLSANEVWQNFNAFRGRYGI